MLAAKRVLPARACSLSPTWCNAAYEVVGVGAANLSLTQVLYLGLISAPATDSIAYGGRLNTVCVLAHGAGL